MKPFVTLYPFVVYFILDFFVSSSYPETMLKVAAAKGIVEAFPELADSGDCPWVS